MKLIGKLAIAAGSYVAVNVVTLVTAKHVLTDEAKEMIRSGYNEFYADADKAISNKIAKALLHGHKAVMGLPVDYVCGKDKDAVIAEQVRNLVAVCDEDKDAVRTNFAALFGCQEGHRE